MSMRLLLLSVFMILAMLAASPPFAVAHSLLTVSDYRNLVKARDSITALEKDITQVSQASNSPTEDGQRQVSCLLDIYNSLNDISLRLSSLTDLVYLSTMMSSPADEKLIDSLLARALPYHQKQITLSREEVINSSAHCSRSALVNIYAQKSLGLVDDATEAISDIGNRLPGITH